MSDTGIWAAASGPAGKPQVRRIDMDRPWAWLAAGWHDFRSAPMVCAGYGVIFALAGFILALLIWAYDVFYLVLPLTAGFMLMGPILAVGLYEISRRLEAGEPVSLGVALTAWRRNVSQIALMGLMLMLFLLGWIRIATLIFALFFADNPPRPDMMFIIDVFFSASSLPFLIVGTAVGGVLAALVFTFSVVSIPLLLDRDVDVITAVVTSTTVVRENFRPMMVWGWLIVLFVGAGLATAFVGLIVTVPIVGLATWHAYRDSVDWGGA
ncbi:MAG: DUF2189 domain-containing protein [Inquilinus sp.]|nr:DUF2189 domain-containing protein [Inquilinus sp.]